MLEKSGVYLVRCTPTGEYYLGATTTSFRQRFNEHRTQLGRGVCTIPLLQARAARYGVEALEFIPLRDFPLEEIALREREALELLKPALNVCHVRPKGNYERWDKVEIRGKLYTPAEAGRAFGVLTRTIRVRIERGLAGEDLITPPHAGVRKPYVRRA